MLTRVTKDITIYVYIYIFFSFYCFPHAVHFIFMTDLFCNWNFVPLNLPHLFHSSLNAPPLWQPQSIHVARNCENVRIQHLSDHSRDGDNHPIMEVKQVYLFPQKMTFASSFALLWREEEGCRDFRSFLGFCLLRDLKEAAGWFCSTEIFILSQEQRGVQNRPYWDSNPGSPVYKTGALTN